jgi:arylsulfatase A-like enzyme
MYLRSSAPVSTNLNRMRRVTGFSKARFATPHLRALFVVGLVLVSFAAARAQSLPNIVYILADDMGIGDIRSYNATSPVNTPNIDSIANAGVRFTDAHSPSSVCSPTRYGLLTGRYAWRTRLQQDVLPAYDKALIDASTLTVAEMLKSVGYQTGAFGKWHLGANWVTTNPGGTPLQNGINVNHSQPFTGGPTDHGFDTYFGIESNANYPPYAYIRDNRTVGMDLHTPQSPTGQVAGNPFDPVNRVGPIIPGFNITDAHPTITNEAASYIRSKANQASPFFAYIPLTAPHEPVFPPDFATGQHNGNFNADATTDAADYILWRNSTGSQESYATWRTKFGAAAGSKQKYGDFIWSVDWAVGQVLKALKDPNNDGNESDSVLDDTLVVFAADNGAEDRVSFSTSMGTVNGVPLRSDKASIYEGGHRIPFVAQWTGGGVQVGGVNSNYTELNDLMATVADIVDYDLPEGAAPDSRSILANLQSTSATPGRAVGVSHSFQGAFAIRVNDTSGNKWKLIFTGGNGGYEDFSKVNPNAPITDFTKVQLYNLTSDPGELTNLLAGGGTAAMQQRAVQMQSVLHDIVGGRSTINVDFGYVNTEVNFPGWNNISGIGDADPVVTLDLQDQTGADSGIILKTSWFNAGGDTGVATGINYNGSYPSELANLPADALRDGVFMRDGNKLVISLESLNPQAIYDFLFYSAASSGPEWAEFTVVGDTTATAHIAPIVNNATQVATINGITADLTGKIRIDVEGRRPDGTPHLPGVDNDGRGLINFLRIIEHLPGDFNGDRIVDASDYSIWRSSYGATTFKFADGNHDGVVDTIDFALWRQLLATSGAGGGGEFSFAAVPEPASCILLILAAGTLLWRTTRRQRQ